MIVIEILSYRKKYFELKQKVAHLNNLLANEIISSNALEEKIASLEKLNGDLAEQNQKLIKMLEDGNK